MDPSRMRGLFGGSHFNLQPNIKGKEREREREKEQTKLRERHRRAITSRMLAGLRQYGNFPLPARVDMNDVLAALAREAGWTVEADGTTYQQSLPPAQMKEGGIVAWKVWDQFSVFPIIEPQTGVLLKEASRATFIFALPVPSPDKGGGKSSVVPIILTFLVQLLISSLPFTNASIIRIRVVEKAITECIGLRVI